MQPVVPEQLAVLAQPEIRVRPAALDIQAQPGIPAQLAAPDTRGLPVVQAPEVVPAPKEALKLEPLWLYRLVN
ncbi:hypothetical protein [Collimonas sp. OK607]|uniref:hypothetical protein n=1 Tax=Collimonas sp. OK607 TaxID=1798194 RepID=UPI0027380B41|nr:hypothetical protein [Collimonas sp. OK607]